MKRIRIGNDVVVRTSLDEFETNDKLKIKTLQCLFIKQEYDNKSDNDMCYEPSQYVYGCCGCCNYNAAVFNNGYNMPCTLRDPHWFPGYNGFGVNSNKFNCPKEYQSDVRVFDNYVESYFPAKDQKLGIFKVVFVAQVYTTGWGMNDLKTITIDKGELFTLVDSAEESTTDGLIDLTDGQGSDQVDNKLTVDAIEIRDKNFKPYDPTYKLFDYSKTGRWAVDYIKDSCRYPITEDNAKHFKFSILQNGKPAKSTIDKFGVISYVEETAHNGSNSLDDISIIVSSKYNEDINDNVRYSIDDWNDKSYAGWGPISGDVYFNFKRVVSPPTSNIIDTKDIICKKYTKIELNRITDNGIFYYINYSGKTNIDKYFVKNYLTLDSSDKNIATTDEFGNIIVVGKGGIRLTLKNKFTDSVLDYVQLTVILNN